MKADIEEAEIDCGIEFHPHSIIFPLMKGVQFDAFVSDIEQNGMREPIVLLDGQVLDGRNRYRAMMRLDPKFSVETAPKMFTQFDGDDPLEWVISKNLHRRHLKESQRAIIAARVSLASPGKNRFEPGISSPKAARLMGVSTGLVNEAKRVIKQRPEAVPAIEAGNQRIGRHADDGIIHAAIPVDEANAFREHCARSGKSMAQMLREMIAALLQCELPALDKKRSGGRPLKIRNIAA